MYSSELINAYKKAKNYVQDKQVAHDLNLDPPKISKIRKGVRQLTDSEAVFLAENSGIDPELALLGCHADRNENPEIKQMWEHIAKKYNGLGLKAISMTCAGLALMAATPNKALANCVLCILC
ncbi:DUF3693 domain-containing protein [Vibrio campbellii]|uniref:DUF3693 domain-containing protein n=1 Tax=Vibrio TaxID=662 RepID=UPI001EFE4917|nr:DUF3693 domain-containing protein [Vibrio sp. Isolate34]MCG9640391.1 DUF3693 domain-containing protein [Vibrio sp. Isolate34]CAH7223461.1 conserved hypothetical protein [Vibrio chagasii]CAH7393689.1 conserved hypothetical protein [Vibrio chagasii]CAH7393872.1 conserved hypothetical protein [Vibrio chagasii]